MNYNQFSDLELIHYLSTDKKEKAFRTLYDRYYLFVINKCKRVLNNPNEAEDVAQAVFLKLHNRYQSFEGKASFSTWLYAITYRSCIDYMRQTKKMTITNIDFDERSEQYEHIQLDEDMDIETERNMMLLDKINPFDKALLLMKYKDGLKLSTIAEALQMGESNIKMRLKRAKAKLLKMRNLDEKKVSLSPLKCVTFSEQSRLTDTFK